MTWFEERYARYEKLVHERQLVLFNGRALFESLWKEIISITKSAEEKKIKFQTSGDPENRTIAMILVGNPFQAEFRRLDLKLTAGFRSVVAASDAGKTTLPIVVCPDGVVCFSSEQGSYLTIDQASKAILEPFIFEGQSPFSDRVASHSD